MMSKQPTTRRQALEDVGVLVTRPAGQADSLCRLIETQGGRALRFPVLEIQDPADASRLTLIYERLTGFDIAIFVSANAVRKTAQWVLAGRPWPSTVRTAAVGPSSVAELKHCGLPSHISPLRKYSSEGLLELQELRQVNGKRIIIFRGDGGKRLLGDTLQERGAGVETVEVYRRAAPQGDLNRLLQVFKAGEIDVITVSSLESLRNLLQMMGEPGLPWLRVTPMIVINKEMLELVQRLGGDVQPIQADNATDPAIMEALLTWSEGRF